MKTLSQIIMEERKKAGLTQTELGELLGVKKNAVCKWEKGRVLHIGQDKIFLMSKIFGVSPSYLLGFDSDTEVEQNLKISNDKVASLVSIANAVDTKNLDRLLSYARYLFDNPAARKNKGEKESAERKSKDANGGDGK